jgi:hypothetical protein
MIAPANLSRITSPKLNLLYRKVTTLPNMSLKKPFYYKTLIIIILLHSLAIYGQKTFNSISTINLEGGIRNMDVIFLSQFTGNIRYVPIETKDVLVISHILECKMCGNQFLLTTSEGCWLFDINGKLSRKIGARGRGPGEYQFLDNAVIDNQNNIYIQSLRDILQYKSDGSFNKRFNNLFFFNKNYADLFSNWAIVDDSLIFGHIPNERGENTLKARLINQSGKIKKEYKNYDKFLIPRNSIRNSPDHPAHICFYNNSLYYKGPNNDTLFFLDRRYDLIPRYVFDAGKYKEPLNKRSILFRSNTVNKYFSVMNVFQTENYLILRCELGDFFPAKRLTPIIKELPNTGKIKVWKNTTKTLCIYDKRTEKLSFIKPTDTDNPLFTSGFYNDIDAGPRFLPEGQLNDSTMVMWVDAKKLKEHVASNDFKNAAPKFSEKKKELEKLAGRLSEFDNPVLMIVTFRSK